MFAKFALAVALVAGGAVVASDISQAQGRDGARRGGKAPAMVTVNRRQAAPSRRAGRTIVRRDVNVRPGRRFARVRHDRRWIAPRFRPHKCVAVARTRGGTGFRIRGVRGVARGRGACAVALYECRSELGFLKRRGRNPFAACVVARRG